MELCQDVLDGLAVLRDKTRIDSASLKRLTQIVEKALTASANDDHLNQLKNGDEKLVTMALASLYVEVGRLNTGAKAEASLIKATLEDVDISADYVEIIVGGYLNPSAGQKTGLRDALHNHLSKLSIKDGSADSKRKLVDADWRQELVIKTKNIHHANQLSYLISLKTNKDDETGPINFTCTLEQLQDLTSKVREAAKIVESTLSNQ